MDVIVDTQSSSDDDAEELIWELKGTMSKWTNYIHGWQSRFFVLKAGQLSYYKSEGDTTFGCRGAISIERAVIQIHDMDDCRFDISVNDCVWYLRTEYDYERQNWLDAIEAFKADSGFGSQGDLRRHGSIVSLTSNKSLASITSLKKSPSLREKIADLETYRDTLFRQIDTLQSFFDSFSDSSDNNVPKDDNLKADDVNSPDQEEFPQSVHSPSEGTADFTEEALRLKATTLSVINTLFQCTEIMQQRDETWKARLDKEVDKRKRYQQAYYQATKEAQRPVMFGGPDFEEGPHSALNEEEWHDAVEAELERQDNEDKRLQHLFSNDAPFNANSVRGELYLMKKHPLFNEIDSTTLEQLRYAQTGVEEGMWQLFAEDGDMKMFKRELEIDGLACDPLKAVHAVKGVTAYEYCKYFFEPQYKMDWDTTLEQIDVLERVSDDTVVMLQLHKRVWPAAQRESLFWSHMRRMMPTKSDSSDVRDIWIVCNHDTQHEKAPANSKCIRVGLTVAMVCQTLITSHKEPLTRNNIACKIVYVAQVNPGGWAPSSVLRAVYKREYPKFLKRFTQYVVQKTQKTPITF